MTINGNLDLSQFNDQNGAGAAFFRIGHGGKFTINGTLIQPPVVAYPGPAYNLIPLWGSWDNTGTVIIKTTSPVSTGVYTGAGVPPIIVNSKRRKFVRGKQSDQQPAIRQRRFHLFGHRR